MTHRYTDLAQKQYIAALITEIQVSEESKNKASTIYFGGNFSKSARSIIFIIISYLSSTLITFITYFILQVQRYNIFLYIR